MGEISCHRYIGDVLFDSCTISLLQQKASLKANIVLPSPDDNEEEEQTEDDSGKKKKKPEWKWKPLRDTQSQGPLVYPIFQVSYLMMHHCQC